MNLFGLGLGSPVGLWTSKITQKFVGRYGSRSVSQVATASSEITSNEVSANIAKNQPTPSLKRGGDIMSPGNIITALFTVTMGGLWTLNARIDTVRDKVDSIRDDLSREIKALDNKLSEEIKAGDNKLSEEIKAGDAKLTEILILLKAQEMAKKMKREQAQSSH